MALDLKPEDAEIILNILQQYFPNIQYRVFGSRLKGTSQKYSDLDLTVIADAPIPLTTLSSIENTFSESPLPFKIDLVDWHRISKEFQDHIQQNSIPFPIQTHELNH